MTHLDPVAEFHSLKPNTRAHAAFWLLHGALHPEIHHVIRAKIEPWITRIETAGCEVLDKLRALVLAEQGAS